jgi:hypothetical protein
MGSARPVMIQDSHGQPVTDAMSMMSFARSPAPREARMPERWNPGETGNQCHFSDFSKKLFRYG